MLMGRKLCKELALVVATWPAALHGLARIRPQMTPGRFCKFLSLREKNLQNSQVFAIM